MLPQIFLDACETVQAREFLTHFLSEFPAEYQTYLRLCRFAPHEILISAAAVSRDVFILLDGTLCAMESRVQNLPFVFAKLYPGAIVGDYELFAQTEESYATILSLQKKCVPSYPSGHLSGVDLAQHISTAVPLASAGTTARRSDQVRPRVFLYGL